MRRYIPILLAVALLGAFVTSLALAKEGSQQRPMSGKALLAHYDEVVKGYYKGHGAEYWHWRYKQEHKALTRLGNLTRAEQTKVRNLVKVLSHRPSSLEALRLTAIAYGHRYTDLVRVAKCESPPRRGETEPPSTLVNTTPVWNGEHATGLMQFLPSTFASTPYRGENIFSPYANALAAGWMWDNGRRGEWACR